MVIQEDPELTYSPGHPESTVVYGATPSEKDFKTS